MNRSLMVTIALTLLVLAGLGYWLALPREQAAETNVQSVDGSAEESAAGTISQSSGGASGGQEGEAGAAESAVSEVIEEPATTPQGLEVRPRDTQEAALPTEPGDAEQSVAPSFDIVRVERSGSAVVAGRAEPGAEVELRRNGEVIGRTKADSRGEWVLLPDKPLPSGQHELDLIARDAQGGERASEEVVVLVVPETQAAEGTAQSDVGRGSEALAVLVPRDDQPAKVLQGEGIVAGDLSLETLEYDEAGKIVLSGEAKPQDTVVIYMDNEPLGQVEADEAGRWSFSPSSAVEPGVHMLRVDRIGKDGQVLARLETPFSRANFLVEPVGEDFVVVQPGNSLWRIARATYGKGLRYTVIFEANTDQIRDPDLIYPGQIFILPGQEG